MEDGTLVTVKVLLFAKARELSGAKFGTLKIKSTTSYDCLLSEVVNNFALEQIRNNILLAVNEELRDPKSVICLKEGDEVAVIPPISGDEKLSLEEISGLVTKSSCGAVSFFVGTTRENFEDKKVIHLEYEAYEPMAVTAIKKICEEIRSQWKVENIAVYHRLGVVPVKEASVVIAVSSVHRSDSLQAVQYGIDTLKASVPIWKKEVYEMSPPEWKENQECSKRSALREHSYIAEESCSFNMQEVSVPPHMIQVNASNEEIKHRMEMFMKRKREAINVGNVRDFCRDRGPGVRFSTCARVDAFLVPRKDSKSHLKVRRVLNKWGPQTSGLDPGSGDVKPEVSTAVSSGVQKIESPNIGVSYPGIEERIQNVEKYLQITNGPVPKDIYTRLKQVEDKILYLESISPEYSNWGQPQPEPVKKDVGKFRKKSYTVMDIAQRIKEMESSLVKNEDN